MTPEEAHEISDMIESIKKVNPHLEKKINEWRSKYIYKPEFISKLSIQHELSYKNSAIL